MNRSSRPHARFVGPLLALHALLLYACMAGGGGDGADPSAPAEPDASTTPTRKTDGAEPTLAERGARYVHARGCVRCHQSDDAADGILSGRREPRPGTLAYPKNLTPDLETGLGDWSDRLILRAIREGVDDGAAPLCATMPRYVDMSDDEGAAIVAYLRALAPVHRVIPESRCGSPMGDSGSADARAGDAHAEASAAADSGGDGGAPACAGLASPQTPAPCHACGTRACQPNGCYGGYVCDTATRTCHPAPSGCAAAP